MLDNEGATPEELEIELPESLPEDGADEAAPEAELVITIGDETPEDDDDEIDETGLEEKQVSTLRTLRQKLKEQGKAARDAERRAQEAAARLAAIEASAKPKLEARPAPKPVDYGYDDDLFAKAYEDWREHDDAVRAQQRKAQEEAKAAEAALAAKAQTYVAGKKALRVANYDEAEQAVIADLSIEQQRTILECAADPAKLVYALGNSPKARQELAAIKDPRQFGYRLAQIEGGIKVTQKTPPPVEPRLKGGNGAGAVAGSWATRIAAAEKQAEQTGDRTKVIQLRREAKAAGAKV